MRKPNVVVIMADQLRYDFVTSVHMPNLRALAAESAVFPNAYCAAPLCVPSRGAFFTGRYPNSTGCLINPWAETDIQHGLIAEGRPISMGCCRSTGTAGTPANSTSSTTRRWNGATPSASIGIRLRTITVPCSNHAGIGRRAASASAPNCRNWSRANTRCWGTTRHRPPVATSRGSTVSSTASSCNRRSTPWKGATGRNPSS